MPFHSFYCVAYLCWTSQFLNIGMANVNLCMTYFKFWQKNNFRYEIHLEFTIFIGFIRGGA